MRVMLAVSRLVVASRDTAAVMADTALRHDTRATARNAQWHRMGTDPPAAVSIMMGHPPLIMATSAMPIEQAMVMMPTICQVLSFIVYSIPRFFVNDIRIVWELQFEGIRTSSSDALVQKPGTGYRCPQVTA